MTARSVINDHTPEQPSISPGHPPYRVCFVCTGNICRSPMAASVFQSRIEEVGLAGRVVVDSAGTGAFHEGDRADSRAIAVLNANGYTERHIARQFKPGWFADRHLIIALDQSHFDFLERLAPTPVDAAKVRLLRGYDPDAGANDLDVPDPYFGGIEQFEFCLALIEGASEGLLSAVRTAMEDTTAVP